MFNLIEYSNNCSKTSGSLQMCYRDEPALGNNDAIIDFFDIGNNNASFKFKIKIAGRKKTMAQKNLK